MIRSHNFLLQCFSETRLCLCLLVCCLTFSPTHCLESHLRTEVVSDLFGSVSPVPSLVFGLYYCCFCFLFVYIIFSWNYKLKTQMGLHGSLWPTKDFYILLTQWPFQETEEVSQWRVADTLWLSLEVGERARWLSLLWGNCPHHPPQVTIAFCWNTTFLNGI